MFKKMIQWKDKTIEVGDFILVQYLEELGASRVGKKMDGKWFEVTKINHQNKIVIRNPNGLNRIIRSEHIVNATKPDMMDNPPYIKPYGLIR